MIFTHLQLLLHLGATLTWSRIHSTGNQPINKQPTILQTIQSVLLQTEMFLHEHTILANSEVFLGFPDDAGSFFPKALIGFVMIPVTAQALPFWHTQLD